MTNDWERKLDHRLKAALTRAASDSAEQARSVSVFVRFTGDVSRLKDLGCAVGTTAGDIATARVQLADVQRLAQSDAVVFVELATPAHLDT